MARLLILFLFFPAIFLGQSTLTNPGRQAAAPPCDSTSPDPARCTSSPTLPFLTIDTGRTPYTSPEGGLPARVPMPPLLPTEFERFVEDVTGHRVPIYGRALFDNVPTTFAPVDRVPVPADYVLGPGDELLIHAWGKIDLDARVTVDRNGQISLPKVGTLDVAGLRYNQLESYLQAAVGRLFKGFDLSVTLGQLRSIQIYVLGSARRPGVYTVGSLSTLVNALFVSGGPSSNGSMRHIQLIRSNAVISEFDLYDLVNHGDKSHDRPLFPGDILFIPPVGPQAAILGSVQDPAIYELGGETTVASALQSAGGLTSTAGTGRALLERIDDHTHRLAEEFPLDAAGLQRSLQNGDLLQIFPVSPKFENVVTLRGHVAQPGRYAWHEGMRISDLIPSRTFLLTREYWNREDHVVPSNPRHPFGDPSQISPQALPGRESTGPRPSSAPPSAAPQDDASLSSAAQRDNIRFPTDETGTEDESQYPRSGEDRDDPRRTLLDPRPTNTPDTLPTSGKQKSIDIVRNNVEINWHYASIERLDQGDLSPRLIAFQLGNAIEDHTSPDNQLLQPGDVITVFSRQDIPLPVEEHSTFIRVGGEVNAPGIYRVKPGDTLRDAVKLAGGLTPHSYLYASQLLRVSTREIQEEQLKRSTEQMQRELSASFANNSLPSTDRAAEESQLAMRQALIARIASIAPTGRVVLEMKTDANTIADIPDFTLEDGDSFYIPPRLSTVQVSGAVYNENAFRYQKNKLTTAYLEDAGGATRDADVKRMFLVRADGTVISRQTRGHHQHASFEKTVLLPGDAIVIPVRLNAGTGWKQLEEITGILSQSALTAASLAVIQK